MCLCHWKQHSNLSQTRCMRTSLCFSCASCARPTEMTCCGWKTYSFIRHIHPPLFHANYSVWVLRLSKVHTSRPNSALGYTMYDPAYTNISICGLTDSESRTERERSLTDGLCSAALIELSRRDSRVIIYVHYYRLFVSRGSRSTTDLLGSGLSQGITVRMQRTP